jgi:hypothetical protein
MQPEISLALSLLFIYWGVHERREARTSMADFEGNLFITTGVIIIVSALYVLFTRDGANQTHWSVRAVTMVLGF